MVLILPIDFWKENILHAHLIQETVETVKTKKKTRDDEMKYEYFEISRVCSLPDEATGRLDILEWVGAEPKNGGFESTVLVLIFRKKGWRIKHDKKGECV